MFHQHIRVGRLAIAQGASAFSKDVPPYTLAAERNTVAGLNIVGLRRAGLTSDQRKEVKDAFNLLYRSGYNTKQALEEARKRTWGPNAQAFFDFVATANKRGICALLRSGKGGLGRTRFRTGITALVGRSDVRNRSLPRACHPPKHPAPCL